MNINIFGSTGIIGRKTLELINKNFSDIKVNLLCANSNYNLLLAQANKFKPKYIYLNDINAHKIIKKKIRGKTKILNYDDLINYLKNSQSNFTILAISGYKSLNYLDSIIQNTKNLGLVNKEAVVSAGHIFKNKKYFKKTKIYPIDSEHFSLFEYFNNNNLNNKYRKIIITASGGPFFKKKYSSLKNISFNQAIKHPKWKMGYKNSIDSATLVNKCLEIIEAHYLFNIPYENIKILIHPEAIVHSIVEKENFVSHMNLFQNDMSIPIINFLMQSNLINKKIDNRLFFDKYSSFNFIEVKNSIFPIYKYFMELDKNDPSNLIKFNIGNEFGVNLFKKNMIKYTDIFKIIKKVGSLNLNYPLNTIKDIILYHECIERKIYKLLKNTF